MNEFWNHLKEIIYHKYDFPKIETKENTKISLEFFIEDELFQNVCHQFAKTKNINLKGWYGRKITYFNFKNDQNLIFSPSEKNLSSNLFLTESSKFIVKHNLSVFNFFKNFSFYEITVDENKNFETQTLKIIQTKNKYLKNRRGLKIPYKLKFNFSEYSFLSKKQEHILTKNYYLIPKKKKFQYVLSFVFEKLCLVELIVNKNNDEIQKDNNQTRENILKLTLFNNVEKEVILQIINSLKEKICD